MVERIRRCEVSWRGDVVTTMLLFGRFLMSRTRQSYVILYLLNIVLKSNDEIHKGWRLLQVLDRKNGRFGAQIPVRALFCML